MDFLIVCEIVRNLVPASAEEKADTQADSRFDPLADANPAL
jgi:hypothetical protein